MMLRTRLKSLLNEISGDSCADIGCDHGKLIVSALKENKVKYGYGIDISPSSLNKAEILSREENLSSRLFLLCGDGAEPLPIKVSVAVIAGMGATETVHILKQKDFASKYVLSPHQDTHVLRKYLFENGYNVKKDYYIFEKKYYPIIVCEKGISNYSPDEFYFGKNIPETKEFTDFLNIRTKVLSKLIDKIANVNSATQEEWEECKKWNNKK